MGLTVRSYELREAIYELTRDTRFTTVNEIYNRYFRDRDRTKFNRRLSLLEMDALVTSRRHPRVDDDRLVALTEEGQALAFHRRRRLSWRS
jgi:hypothetical protein